MKIFTSASVMLIALSAAATAHAAQKCRAILLSEGIDDNLCVQKDELLMNLSDKDWNRLVCNSKGGFSLEGTSYLRDQASYGLSSSGSAVLCEWEVRANSGK